MPTVVTGTPGVAGNLQAEQQTYFSKQLLKQANYKMKLDQFAYKEALPDNSSKTISFSQYSDYPVATTILTEGTPPAEQLMTVTPITATTDQYGSYTLLTDLASLTVKHPIITKTTELLSTQAARTYDRLINATLQTGTNVIYPGAIVSRATLATSSVVTMTEVKKAVALLRNNGAEEFDDGNFVCIIDPSVDFDLQADVNFQQTVYRQNNVAKLNENYKGTVVTFAGVTFVRTNNIPTVLGGTGGTIPVHFSYVFGQNYYAVTDLQTLKMYTQKPGSIADPIEQRMTMGWKFATKSVILNNNFGVRIESASNN